MMNATGTERATGRPTLIWAWVCVGLIPVAYVVATLVGGGLLGLAGVEEAAVEASPPSIVLPIGLLSVAIMIAPAVAAVPLGIRAARLGYRSGIVAAVIGGVVAVAGVVLNLVPYLLATLLT